MGALHTLHNMLEHSDLSFHDFVEVALYHPEHGYYSRSRSPVGREGDYVTSPVLSPVFSFTLGRLVREFLSRYTDETCSIVDIGCGDGALIREVARLLGCPVAEVARPGNLATWQPGNPTTRFFGVDRSLSRAVPANGVTYVRTLDEIPRGGAHLIINNELFDALPFARLVQRGEDLHELWVTERDGSLDWIEREASPAYEIYFAARGVELQDGQFADISLEWEALYADICNVVDRGLIVTFDYGYPQSQLFHPRARRFGTAAAYAQQRVTRDLLAHPGEQDLTAHINFDDLIRAGEARGFSTRFFDRQAKFLLALGAAEHDVFTREPVSVDEAITLREQREDARRLLLPDDIGHDIRALVQVKPSRDHAWSFERPLF
jgi:SAM-dependent MidA family methyltransferase